MSAPCILSPELNAVYSMSVIIDVCFRLDCWVGVAMRSFGYLSGETYALDGQTKRGDLPLGDSHS